MNFVRMSLGSTKVEEKKWYLVQGDILLGFRPVIQQVNLLFIQRTEVKETTREFQLLPGSLALKLLWHLKLNQKR